MRVASCRVKIVRIFDLDLAALLLELGFFVRSDEDVLFLGFIQALGIKAELPYLRDGIVLVVRFNESIGLFAAGIDCRVGEFGHNSFVASFLGIFQDFLNRGFAFKNAAQAVRPERGHAQFDGLLPDDHRRAPAEAISSRIGSVMSSSS